MKTATYFRAYRIATELFYRAQEQWSEYSHDDVLDIEQIDAWERVMLRRFRQQKALAARITADLAADEWTYITDDPATLPADSAADGWTWYSAAWVDTDGSRKVEKSSFQNGEWYDWGGPGATLRGPDWRVYAWRPWPTPPPIEVSE